MEGGTLVLGDGAFQVDAALNGEDLALSRALIDLREHGRIEASGNVASAGDQGEIQFTLTNIDLALAQPFLGDTAAVRLGQGRANGTGQMTLRPDGLRSQFNGDVSLTDWGLSAIRN